MEISSYREELKEALVQLSACDEESFTGLWNFLYDWGNRLPPCVGKVKLVLLSDVLDEESRDLLEGVESILDLLTRDFKGAVIDYAQQVSEGRD